MLGAGDRILPNEERFSRGLPGVKKSHRRRDRQPPAAGCRTQRRQQVPDPASATGAGPSAGNRCRTQRRQQVPDPTAATGAGPSGNRCQTQRRQQVPDLCPWPQAQKRKAPTDSREETWHLHEAGRVCSTVDHVSSLQPVRAFTVQILSAPDQLQGEGDASRTVREHVRRLLAATGEASTILTGSSEEAHIPNTERVGGSARWRPRLLTATGKVWQPSRGPPETQLCPEPVNTGLARKKNFPARGRLQTVASSPHGKAAARSARSVLGAALSLRPAASLSSVQHAGLRPVRQVSTGSAARRGRGARSRFGNRSWLRPRATAHGDWTTSHGRR